jgi:hypothetical protein
MTVVVDGTSGITTNSGTVVSTTDATLNGLTVGKGGGATSTNTAVGSSALNATNTIGNCTAFGYQALTLTTGKQNTAVGSGAGASMTSGEGLAAFGWNAANLNTADSVTAIGHNCLGANTTGANNVGVGNAALTANTTGASNVAVGRQALVSNTTASNNTAVGYQAGYYQTGDNNSWFGIQAGIGGSGSSGTLNTGIGRYAMYSLTSGGSNSALGSGAMSSITTGSGNVAIGRDAGAVLTTGSYNILIGYQTASSGKTGGVDCIYIGRTITANNTNANGELVINTNGNNVTGKGDGTGLIATGGNVYQQNNSSSWATTSDQRLKKNIVDHTEGLDKITQIRVRNFEYRLPEEVTELPSHTAVAIEGVQLGVIAQELQQVLPDCVKEESTGVLSVDTSNITWHMINAIKDLKTIVDAQAAEIAEIKAKA